MSMVTINGINPLNAELNPICHLLALLGAHHILHVSRIRVNMLGVPWGTKCSNMWLVILIVPNNTGLFEMIVGVSTTCHKQYT